MASGSERAAPVAEETADALPRTDVDLESDLDALREWVKSCPSLLHHCIWMELEEFDQRVEQITALLPKEVRRARRICREEQRIIQDAKDEARRLLEESRAEGEQIVADARAEADRLIEASAIRQRALEQAEATVAKAEQAAREIRENSYNYAQQVITNVEVSLRRLTQSVEEDKGQLEQMRPSDG
jgi:cell division septum initiation protein DivIVA